MLLGYFIRHAPILVWPRLFQVGKFRCLQSFRHLTKLYRWQDRGSQCYGRIRLPASTVNRAYELLGISHVTSFRKYRKHSIRPSTYGQWVRTYSELFSCKFVLTVCNYKAQSNETCTYRRVSRVYLPRVRSYGLPYSRTVEYEQCFTLLTRTTSSGCLII